MNIVTLFQERVKKDPKKTALVYDGGKLSFSELEETSNRLANGLIRLGVSKGDRVTLTLPHGPELITSFLGVAKAGGIAVPMEPKYPVEELDPLFSDCEPKVCISATSFCGAD